MQAQTKELWLQLCEQAASEQDPEKFRSIVRQISVVLELKTARLGRNDPHPSSSAPGFIVCSLCRKPVPLESSKTDENGKAVHEECYMLMLRLKAS